MRFVKSVTARWRLRPVVSRLPAQLFRAHEPADFYTVAQVKAVADALRFKPDLLPYAYAVACKADEFKRSAPEAIRRERARLRKKIEELFGIERKRYGCKYLFDRFHRPWIGAKDPGTEPIRWAEAPDPGGGAGGDGGGGGGGGGGD